VSVAGRGASKPTSSALSSIASTTLGRKALAMSEDHGGTSGYHSIHAGVDGLALRLQIIRHAERTLDLQYFIFRADETGTLVREELRHAADRGVRVRVLVDDGDTAPGDEKLLELDGYPNMQVWVFNPFDTRSHHALARNFDFLLHKSRLDYRMHNKLLVADNAIALVGGRNIGNQYFQVAPDSQFADDEVFVIGPLAQQLSHEFDQFWNGDMTVPAHVLGGLPAYRPPSSIPVVPGGSDYLARIASGEPYQSFLSGTEPLIWTEAKLIYDSPDKRYIEQRQERGRLMSEAVEQEIGRAREEALIISPYFVPSAREVSLLQTQAKKNVTVKVLTNSLEAAPSLAAHSGYHKLRERLVRSGVRLYEVRARLDSVRGSGQSRRVSKFGTYALHAKLYVFDRRRCFIGSWNYDQRSLRINTEMGLLIDNAALATDVARRFDAMTVPGAAYQVLLESDSRGRSRLVWETEIDHRPVRLFEEPSRGWWQREREKLLKLLPLEPEL
jgi:putative cardiolipin synthase